jgi:hypothetical protein
MTAIPYNRESILKEGLNAFLAREFSLLERDYCGNMSVESLLCLKSVLGDINNVLTLRVSLAFIEWIAPRLKFDEPTKAQIKEAVLSTKPNTNGFDITVASPVPLVAEVKCNVPINRGKRYGSQQWKGIEKDVSSLLQGKSKARIDLGKCLKFLALLDDPAVRDATDHLARISTTCRDRLVLPSETFTFDRHDVVYVVYLKL